MLALSITTFAVAAIALYISSKIKDDVFKAGMCFTSLTFTLVTLVCAPWLVKLAVATIPLIMANLNFLSPENLN
ncbi:MAG: hypothetical protein ACFCU5_07525 [Pleurocapsa sp.]